MGVLMKLAWRNVRRNRRRTLITSFVLIISVSILVFFNGLLAGFLESTIQNNVELETGHVKVYPEGYHARADMLPLDRRDGRVAT